MTGIYMIRFGSDESAHFYIGQSIDIEKRKQTHLSELRNGTHANSYLQNVFNKYGEESMTFEILCECPEEKLNELEEYYIYTMYAFVEDRLHGLNLTTGGLGHHNVVISEEAREKRSNNTKSQWKNKEIREKRINGLNKSMHTEEYRKKQSENMKKNHEDPEYKKQFLDRVRSEEFRKQISNTNKGRALSDETKQKMSKAKKGRVLSDETKQKMSDARRGKNNNPKLSKPVLCVETGKVFPSIKEAKRFMKDVYKKNVNIGDVLAGRKKTAGGFHWEYYSHPISQS